MTIDTGVLTLHSDNFVTPDGVENIRDLQGRNLVCRWTPLPTTAIMSTMPYLRADTLSMGTRSKTSSIVLIPLTLIMLSFGSFPSRASSLVVATLAFATTASTQGNFSTFDAKAFTGAELDRSISHTSITPWRFVVASISSWAACPPGMERTAMMTLEAFRRTKW